MPSKNMLPKGDRRKSVKAEYRAQRTAAQERDAARADAAAASGEPVTRSTSRQPINTSDFSSPAPSPWAGHTHLITSGPESGKMPPEWDTQSTPRYTSPYHFEEPAPEVPVLEDLEAEDGVRTLTADPAAANLRLDAYLAKALPDISRARVVLLIEGGQVTVDGQPGKGKNKLKGGELIEIEGDPRPAPLNATPEDIPLTIVYEDDDLAVIDKPAGMMVHAGSGAPEHNAGTLVNALLHHFGQQLSGIGGDLRPGIVHRLDKQTSGLIVVAKNDSTHRKLGEMFSGRELSKTYIALVHGLLKDDVGTIQLPISRDLVRRIRMTTKRPIGPGNGARSAVSHYKVLERIGTPEKPGPFGNFSLVEVRIETGRTHQIRVHMQALGHPVVGDFLYGAPHFIRPVVFNQRGLPSIPSTSHADEDSLSLDRNFLHAAELEFDHPRTGETLSLTAALPLELTELLDQLR